MIPPAPYQGRPGHAVAAVQSALYALPDSGAVVEAIAGALRRIAEHAETRAETNRIRAVVEAIDSAWNGAAPSPPGGWLSALCDGAAALRADAASADGAGPLADPDGAARDRDSASILDAVAAYLHGRP